MKKSEFTCYYRLWTFLLLTVILTTQCSWHNDTIASIRAVGNQCTMYTIEVESIEVPEVENIK